MYYNRLMKRLRIPLSILATIVAMGLIGLWVTTSHAELVQRAEHTQQKAEQEKPATSEELLTLVNAEREKASVAPLVANKKLYLSAQWKAERMAETENFAHIDPATGKNDGLEYLDSLNAGCSQLGENLVWSDEVGETQTAQEAFEAWMSSEGHRKALLNPEYTKTGFGLVDGIAVEHFCKP